MGNFKLDYRVLLEDEIMLLFGRDVVKRLKTPALKVKSVENYFELFQELHAGSEIILDDFLTVETPLKVYIYCDIPAGSKCLDERSRSNTIYNTPIVYSSYCVNSLFMPALSKISSIFYENVGGNTACDMYSAANFKYSSLLETIHSGMFLNIYKGRVISASSYRTLHNLALAVNSYMLRNNSLAQATPDEATDVYNNLSFNVPTEVVKKYVEEPLKVPTDLINSTNEYLSTYRLNMSSLSNSFDWTQDNASITVSADYVNLNGFAHINNTAYVLFGNGNQSPLNTNGNGTSNFSNAIDEALRSTMNTSALFSLAQSSRSYGSGGNSFVFLNENNLDTTKLTRACGVQEYVEINKEFVDSLKQIYADGNTQDIEKFRKAEFALKRESVVSDTEVINNRYIPLKNKDKKLLVLTKTSLAKQAARKMAITRKITAAVMPVIDMAVRLFMLRDFELGFTDTKYGFPVQSRFIFNHSHQDTGNKYFTDNPTLLTSFDKQKEASVKLIQTKADAIASTVISSLYTDVNYEGTPFWDILNNISSSIGYYRGNFSSFTLQKQENMVFAFTLLDLSNTFARTGKYCIGASDYFSPSSGLINIVNLTTTVYKRSHTASFRPELAYLKYQGYGDNATGKHLHYLYSNNFIGTDQQQADEIERLRNEDYIHICNYFTNATSAFSFQQDALDTFVTLKKCKTLTDYYTWFKVIHPTLKSINKDVLEKDEYAVYHGVDFFLETCDKIFESLVKLEEPFIPKEEVKKRGRKAKTTAATVAVTVDEEVSAEPINITVTYVGETNEQGDEKLDEQSQVHC